MLVSPYQKAVVPAHSQAAVLAQLRNKIGCLEGVERRSLHTVPVCDSIDGALPYKGLPLGCVHEVKGTSLASAIAFASFLSTRASQRGAILYIGHDRSLHPLGLLPSGVKLEQIIHVSARRPKDLAWTALEAIRCPGVSAVLAVLQAADLTFCRRLQLAAEGSGVTGFLLGHATSSPVASAITRWRILSIKAPPGRGFEEAFWELELSYCRGGQPGKWRVVWRQDKLEPIGTFSEIPVRPMQSAALASETALAG